MALRGNDMKAAIRIWFKKGLNDMGKTAGERVFGFLVLVIVVGVIGYCVYDSIMVSGWDHHFCLAWHSGNSPFH